MNFCFEEVIEDFYVYSNINDKSSNKKDNKTLSIFNFFGTIAWGEKGNLIDYDRIVASSPFCKENLKNLKDKGYTICILEYIPKHKLTNFLYLIEMFFRYNFYTIDIHFFVYTKSNIKNIKEGLIEYFKLNSFNQQLSKFGPGSFYCGDELGKGHIYPWFRNSNKDIKIAEILDMKIYDPISVIGCFQEYEYNPDTLYITCGKKYSGYELDYEEFIEEKLYKNIKFKIMKKEERDIYGIKIEDLIRDCKEVISFEKNMTIIVFGSNPSLLERTCIRNLFTDYEKSCIYLYTRPNHKKIKDDTYEKNFQNPLFFGEEFVRIN